MGLINAGAWGPCSNRCRVSMKCQGFEVHVLINAWRVYYEGRSINKLQNGAIPPVLKIGKIWNIRFVGSLILNIHTTFLDDDVIIVTSAVNRTQSIWVLFVPTAYHRNSQVINSIQTILVFHLLTCIIVLVHSNISLICQQAIFWMLNAKKNNAGCSPNHCERLIAPRYLMRISAPAIFFVSPKR